MGALMGDEEDFEPGGAMPMPSFLQHFITSLNGNNEDAADKEKSSLIPAPEKKTEAPTNE